MEGRKKPIEIVDGPTLEEARVGLAGLRPVSNKKNCRIASDAGELAGMLHERGLLQ